MSIPGAGDVSSLTLVVVLAGLAVGWAAQGLMVMRQTNRFNARLGALRSQGIAAVGRGGSRLRGFTYVALAAGVDGRIVAAEAMRGATVFAGLKPVSDLVGRPIDEVASASSSAPRARAAAHAARLILEHTSGADARRASTPSTSAAASATSKEEAP